MCARLCEDTAYTCDSVCVCACVCDVCTSLWRRLHTHGTACVCLRVWCVHVCVKATSYTCDMCVEAGGMVLVFYLVWGGFCLPLHTPGQPPWASGSLLSITLTGGALGLRICKHNCVKFYMSSGNPNSSFHNCAASSLPNEPFPQASVDL